MDKWKALKDALQNESDSMEREFGKRIVEVNIVSDVELVLIHKIKLERLLLIFVSSMGSVRWEDSAGNVSFDTIDSPASFALDMTQKLSG